VPTGENPSQLSLDIQAEPVESCSFVQAKQITYTRTNITTEKNVVHPGRTKLPEHLRRDEIIIDPKEDITGCKKIEEEVTVVLEWQPGELYVKRYVRPKYVKKNGEGEIIAAMPSRPLPKAMADAGLLAQIVIDKYIDHLPLYRQMQRFERGSVKLPYSTLTD
jgi:transposase